MRAVLPATIGVAFICAVAGCGTVLNTVHYQSEDGGKRIFGGVQLDLQGIGEAVEEVTTKLERTNQDYDPAAWAGFLLALDLPFTVVGDMITLPYTLYENIWPVPPADGTRHIRTELPAGRFHPMPGLP